MIELLIVLAILAALLALLLPVLSRARDRSRVPVCASNLRQLYQAFALYAQDNDGRLPPYQNALGSSFGCDNAACGGNWHFDIPEKGKELVAAMKPYIKSDGIWFCPADYLARSDARDGSIRHRYSSYRATNLLGKQAVVGIIVTLDGVTERAFSEKGLGPLGKIESDTNQIKLLWENLWPYYPNAVKPIYSHANTVNTLYLDGHLVTSPWENAPQ